MTAKDNFFGPISPNFIRAGRLSDSAASDENHDITMDSTAFSMHFRRFVRSDSGMDLKTPTEVSFEEKTPTQTSQRSSMELTMAKKPISQSSMPVANFSGISDSSDMSLIGENSRRYDYGRLSPDLEALLAEGRERSHAVSVSGDTSVPKSPTSNKMEVRSTMTDLGGNLEQEANVVVSRNMSLELMCQKIDTDDGYKFLSRVIDGDSVLRSTVPLPENYVDRVNQSPKQLRNHSAVLYIILGLKSLLNCQVVGVLFRDAFFYNPVHATLGLNSLSNCQTDMLVHDFGEKDTSVKDASVVGNRETQCSDNGELGEFCWSSCGGESPLVDLASSSPATPRLITMCSPSPVKHNSMAVSFLEDPISFLSNEKRGTWKSSASLQRSISKLERLKASALSSSRGDRIPNMGIRALEFPKTRPLDSVLKKRNLDIGVKCLDAYRTCTEEQFSDTSMKEGERKMFTLGGSKNEGLSSSDDVIQCDQSHGPEKQGKSLNQLDACIIPIDQQEKVTAIAQKLFSSPKQYLQSKSSTSTEHQSSPFKESKLHDEHVKSFGPVKNASSVGYVTDGPSSTATAGNWHSSSTLTEEQSGSPVVEGSKVLRQPDGTESIEAKLRDQMNELRSNEDSRISGDGSCHLSSAIQDENIQSETGLPRLEIDRQELNKSSSAGAASSSIKNLEGLAVEKVNTSFYTLMNYAVVSTPVKWSSRSPSSKGLHSLAQSNTAHSSVGETMQSPTFNQSIGRPRHSSAHKRSSEELAFGDMEHTDEIITSQRSPKLQRGVGNNPGILGHPGGIGKEMVTAHLELRQWKDINSKFMDDADELILLPKERLTMPAIEMVEDIVSGMQKAKTYDILHSQILTQEKRAVEAIMLLCQLLHEKAKFHLRPVKKEKLLEKCQLLNSGIQKSQMSKINHLLHNSAPVSRGTQGDAISSESSAAREKAVQEVPHNKVASIKEALEISERKVANLTRSLHSSLKLKGEPNCADTIISVKEHFMRRSCCRFLRQDMQNVRKRNGHYDVILNYLGLLVQSLKNFPNINACAALRFVLKAEISKKLGVRTPAQEMQVTRSLLGNSLDVVAEVQKAQTQFRNLTDISFSTPTVEKLELQLHFMNFNTGKKVKLTLDMSCLNRGVYPSEVVPSQFAALAVPAEHSDDPLLGEIRDAVKSLRAGYMRIIRLCDCISQVIQASGGLLQQKGKIKQLG
ncbi:hypothetical protein RND71_013065 [Anisodus tanguticus]|uniref:Uncharacterized protein n=1 Tax=Anisodus tanguticus TaxID=243964 RepID=A0AAE1SH49_9SOLA|nr:hypothetical protein RND71_013065 [Anisodus tanguticus]